MPYSATAQNSVYYLVGGSGGYIYVKTLNKVNQNVIGTDFTIEA